MLAHTAMKKWGKKKRKKKSDLNHLLVFVFDELEEPLQLGHVCLAPHSVGLHIDELGREGLVDAALALHLLRVGLHLLLVGAGHLLHFEFGAGRRRVEQLLLKQIGRLPGGDEVVLRVLQVLLVAARLGGRPAQLGHLRLGVEQRRVHLQISLNFNSISF